MEDQAPILEPRCIYCQQGSTEKNPMLFRVYAPGEYWQHWSFDNIGCDENTENRNPIGCVHGNEEPAREFQMSYKNQK